METIFTKIIRREIPAFIIAEDDNHLAFLDNNPLTEGHTLVIPKTPIDYFFDLNDEDYIKLNLFAKKISKIIKKTFNCKKVGMAVVGLEVNHAHIHLIPINNDSDMSFERKKIEIDSNQMKNIQTLIKSNL